MTQSAQFTTNCYKVGKLLHKSSLTVKEIGKAMNLHPSKIRPMLQHLEAKGKVRSFTRLTGVRPLGHVTCWTWVSE